MDLPVRFAAFAGMLTSLLSMGANSGCGNIFSVMHPITKQTKLINWKLI